MKMTVVQCWDDGLTQDARLTEILRRHKAKATFNLNPGLYKTHAEGRYLGWDEMKRVYDGFSIGNHSLTHPYLEQVTIETARREIVEGRDRLQQFFNQAVLGFSYPYGTYNEAVMDLVREAGHVYARTTENVRHPFPPANPMAFHTCCRFVATDFWQRYEEARDGGVFYFWGHSCDMTTESMWSDCEEAIRRISADPGARWADVADLFAGRQHS